MTTQNQRIAVKYQWFRAK